jgi:hypothetical protein
MAVIVAGQHTFQLDCGVRLPQHPAVLSFTAALENQPNLRPRLTSVTFVPEDFRLQTPEEFAASRQVVVENDLLRRGAASETIEKAAVSPEGRWASIKADLRPPRSGDIRMPGTLEYMDCSGNGLSAVATIDGRRQTFTATKDLMPRWFGVEASQISLACGSSPKKPNVLFTYRVLPQEGARGHELLAMEFLPSDFPMQSVTGPVH